MQYAFKGVAPQVAASVYIAPGVQIAGDVTLRPGVSVWFNAVMRGDVDRITIGENTNIQDLTMIHCDEGFPTVIGQGVTVGHSCIIHGCTIGDNCLIGMGSTILNGARIGENSLVGAGSLITEGKEFPPGSVIMGRPAKVVREVGERELEMIREGAEHYRERRLLYMAAGIRDNG